MPAVSRLLPAAIALALTATLAGGGVAAADLRADEQRAAAERARLAAEQAAARAVADYRTAVTGLAQEVYASAQPFQRAMQDTTDVEPFSISVLDDVSEQLVADKPFDAIRERLTALTPPERIRAQHLQLADSLRTFADAAELAAGVADQASDDDTIPALVTSERALSRASREWRSPVESLFAGQQVPAVPTDAPGGDPVPRPSNHVSYLYDAGSRCAGALARFVEAVEDRQDDPEVLAQAALTRLTEDLPALLAVAVPEPDAGAVRDTIHDPLEQARAASEQAVPLLRSLLDGRGDPASVREIERLLTKGEVAGEQAAGGYRAYGSATCSTYLVGPDEDDEAGPAPDDGMERPA